MYVHELLNYKVAFINIQSIPPDCKLYAAPLDLSKSNEAICSPMFADISHLDDANKLHSLKIR